MLPLAFRFATSDDAEAIVTLVESAYRGESSQAGWTTESHVLAGQRVDRAMVDELLDETGAHVLLAERGGELVACCELKEPGRPAVDNRSPCEPGPAISEGSDTRAAYFGMFAVRPSLQGDGVGKVVLAEAERRAATWGATQLEMTVIDLREELVAWYERRGYVRTGEHRPFPYGDERFGIPLRDDLRLEVLTKRLI